MFRDYLTVSIVKLQVEDGSNCCSLFRISKLYPYKIVKIHSAIPIFHLMVYGKVLKRENIVYLIFAVILVLHICTFRLCSQLDSDKKTSSLHPFLGSPSVNCQTLTGRGRFLISFRNSDKKALCRILTYVILFRHYWIFWENIFWKFLTRKN